MKRLLSYTLLALFLAVACSCGQENPSGYTIPSPPSGGGDNNGGGNGGGNNGGGNENPPSEDDAERLARLGQTPIVAVYFTEYTTEAEFPTLEDVKCFTHINIGHARFVNKETGDGGLTMKDPGPAYLKRLAAYKKDYPELKLLLMVGGWGANANGFSMMARDPEKRKLFCDECVRFCEEYNLDGIDLDWEYPTYAAEGNGADPSDTKNFTTLVKEMREALGPNRLISYAAPDGGDYINNKEVLQWVDYINVMTYSMGDPPYHNSPLYRSSLTRKRSGEESIEIFHNQGVPYDRMNYGMAFYGHADKNIFGSSSLQYYAAVEAMTTGKVNGKDVSKYAYRWWDPTGKNVYFGDAAGTMSASFEDVESLGYRVEFLKNKGMLGAFAWEYREDAKDGTLRKALRKLMNGEKVTNPYPGTSAGGGSQDPNALPEMGGHTTWKLRVSDSNYVPELSGLCLSKDGDFLWGCDDNGGLYKINFDGTFSLHWDKSAEMEGLAMDPATGTMYIGLEDSSNSGYKVPAPGYNSKTNFGWVVEGASSMGNSGVEGIAWYKGDLYLGTQTGATLFHYTLGGQLIEKKSLRTVCSTISEIAGLDYDEEKDRLWVIDSNSNKDKPQYDPYTIYLFDGAATKLLAKYAIGSFADWNPEALCVDKKHGCIWVGEDCGDEKFSLLHKVEFTNL